MFISDELAEDLSWAKDLSWKTGINETLLGMPGLKAQVHTHYDFEKAGTSIEFTGLDANKALEEAQKTVDALLFKQQEALWKPMLPPLGNGISFIVIDEYEKISASVYKIKTYEEYFESDMPILHPDFRRCPAGEYVVEVISMDYKRSTHENPMVIAEMEIVEDGPHRGVTLKAYFVVRESGLVGWDKFLDACGFDDVKPEDDFNIKTCIGSRLQVYVNDEGWIRAYYKENDA